ncbi:MAG: hypothetical protein PHE02_00065 [Lachnospiraceae bacterium]|nr:hypothetical protein [Lachnospiraceae bacterium]
MEPAVKWKENKEKYINGLFYLGLFIELLIVIIDKSAYINPIEGRLFQITFLLFGLKVLFTKYSGKEWIAIFLFGILGAISYFITDRNEIIRVVMFVAASKGISLRKSLQMVFFTILSGVLLLIILSVTGIFGTLYLSTDFGRGVIENRYCLGLGHPNALHCMIWTIIILGFYLYFEKLQWYILLVVFMGNIGLYKLTGSRTGVIIVACTVLCYAIARYWRSCRSRKALYIFSGAAFIMMVVGSAILLHYGYTTGPFHKLDLLLTRRISTAMIIAPIQSWGLFGNVLHTEYFDMGFIRLFYWYGFIPGIIYCVLNLLMIYDYYKRKDIAALLMVILFAAYMVVEAHSISVYIPRNYVLLLLINTWPEILLLGEGEERYLWNIWGSLYRRDSK